MDSVIIIDTSVFLNILDVPGFNQDRDDVFKELRKFYEQGASLLLPVASLFESGNHIAKLSDGNQRRKFASKFVKQVRLALDGEAPWVPMRFPGHDVVYQLCERFPDFATRRLGFGDLSIVEAWEDACHQHPARRVTIWSLDSDLAGYDRQV
jgi:hypothetical protein